MNRMMIVGKSVESRFHTVEHLRVFRLDNKAVKDVELVHLAPVAEKLGIGNIADFVDGTAARLYPKFCGGTAQTILSGANSCYVLGTHGSGGYVCIRPHAELDFIRVIPRSRLVGDAKKGRLVLINAVIELVNGRDTISPLFGEWEDASVLTGRALSENSEDSFTPDQHDKIAASESVSYHDELGMLTLAQKAFLKDYYIGYSVEAFSRIAGATSWKLKPGKTAKLVELQKLSGGENWCFAGLWDSGVFGGEKCEMGHKLRYVYMARPADKTFAQAAQDGTLLKFGIVCHADFLEIPREDVARLGRLQDTMRDEIAFISTAVANSAVAKHNELMLSMHELLRQLENGGKLSEIIGERLASAYNGFCENNLPFVESFVLDAQRKLEDYGALRVLSVAGVDTSGFGLSPVPLYIIPELSAAATVLEKKHYASRCRRAHSDSITRIFRACESHFTALTRYADMLISNDICGEFMYNPTHEITEFRKRGAEKYKRLDHKDTALKYNNETRELRNVWMRYFFNHSYEKNHLTAEKGTKAECLTFAGLESFIHLAKRLRETGQNIAAAVGVAGLEVISDCLLNRCFSSDYRKYALAKPDFLMSVLPYLTPISKPALLRLRCFRNDNFYSKLLDMFAETANGTAPEYIDNVKKAFQM